MFTCLTLKLSGDAATSPVLLSIKAIPCIFNLSVYMLPTTLLNNQLSIL